MKDICEFSRNGFSFFELASKVEATVKSGMKKTGIERFFSETFEIASFECRIDDYSVPVWVSVHGAESKNDQKYYYNLTTRARNQPYVNKMIGSFEPELWHT